MSKTPRELKKDTFTIQVNYSEEAIEKKMMRFITAEHGDAFEVTAEEMSSILVGQVNSELLEATFVESDRVDVVEVQRQLIVRADRDIKKGAEIRLDYKHSYPLEFAIIEETMNIAKINMDVPTFTLTKEYIDLVRKKITPSQKTFIQKFYDFFKGIGKAN